LEIFRQLLNFVNILATPLTLVVAYVVSLVKEFKGKEEYISAILMIKIYSKNIQSGQLMITKPSPK
jgi:hypothetical protein